MINKTLKIPTTIKYGTYKLDILNQSINVPTFAEDIELEPKDQKALALAVKNNLSCLLIGETGVGKTSAIKRIAYLRKQGYTRINMNGYTTPDELIGSKSVANGGTYYEHGVLTKAMIEGHIVVLDEINATPPDIMFVLHGLLDDDRRITLPNGDIITPHPDFRFFATMNPDYEGTRGLNRAFLDRFPIILMVNILAPQKEVELLQNRLSIASTMANLLVATALLNRNAYKEQKTLTLTSTRSLLQWGNLVKQGIPLIQAYTLSIVNKARSDEKQAFLDFYNATFKENNSGTENTSFTMIPIDDFNRLTKSDTDSKNAISDYVMTITGLRVDYDTCKNDYRRVSEELLAVKTGKISANELELKEQIRLLNLKLLGK